jgi:hypothetical protein
MSDPDQCAVGPDGKLLDADKMTWLNNPDDETPLPPVASTLNAGIWMVSSK